MNSLLHPIKESSNIPYLWSVFPIVLIIIRWGSKNQQTNCTCAKKWGSVLGIDGL